MKPCESGQITEKCTGEGLNELPDGRFVCDSCLPFVTGGQAILDARVALAQEAALEASGQMRWD